MLILHQSDYQNMLAHARAGFPNEACGLIAGTIRDGIAEVQRAYLMTNADGSREHFSIDPKEHMAAIKDMRANGYIPLGNWHSHPETPSRPSEEDKRMAYDSNALYLILSLQDKDAPVLNAFRIIDRKEVIKEEIDLK
ncbi:MAG: M67 family metallopeptidase [Roseburia sp.]|nr:M67 family metallopeptidase [Roseburia sp.]